MVEKEVGNASIRNTLLFLASYGNSIAQTLVSSSLSVSLFRTLTLLSCRPKCEPQKSLIQRPIFSGQFKHQLGILYETLISINYLAFMIEPKQHSQVHPHFMLCQGYDIFSILLAVSQSSHSQGDQIFIYRFLARALI